MKRMPSFLALFAVLPCLWAQSIRDNGIENQIPLKRVVILASGLAYYEHSGAVNEKAGIDIPFRLDAVNDALKTLVINDPSSANPSVTYQSEQTLLQTLRSLSIDLSDQPGMAVILSRLRGAEVEIACPTPCTGRIAGVEYRQNDKTMESWLLLGTDQGIRAFNFGEISSVKFKDPVIEQDFNRALDLISESRNSSSRRLLVNLPGSGTRNVTISYVIPSPVWKVSYRLDLGAQKPVFQGWAIVDNDSDNDWNNVELSLVAGRPASFIQNLYPPYYVSRPVMPLSIAGTASAAVHDQGYAPAAGVQYDYEEQESSAKMMMSERAYSVTSDSAAMLRQPQNVAGGIVETAVAADAGGQFEFTIKNPVNLNRRMSAMFPLIDSQIEARKILIYSGIGRHPRLGSELTNTTNMKLPAGPVTVYDGGVYAGDALIEFWNENEKRLISFGEDLSVTAVISDSSARNVSTVSVSGGVMTINRNLVYIKTYTIVNSSSDSKALVVEHAKTSQTELVSPKADEQTETIYRFNVALPANRQTVFTVSEQRPISERITLLSQRPDVILSYTTNQEIPARVRQAFQKAAELRLAFDTAETTVKDIQTQRNGLITDQDRIRRNLEAAGSQTQQGQEYLRRLVALDGEIDALASTLEKAQTGAKAAQMEYENYLNGLNLQP